jgi:hypothetical protein
VNVSDDLVLGPSVPNAAIHLYHESIASLKLRVTLLNSATARLYKCFLAPLQLSIHNSQFTKAARTRVAGVPNRAGNVDDIGRLDGHDST